MNCTCQKDLEAKLLERLKSEYPSATNHHARLGGYSLCLSGNTMLYRAGMPVSQSVKVPKKAGGFIEKKPSLTMFFSYCPFCGQPWNKKEEAAAAVEGGAA